MAILVQTRSKITKSFRKRLLTRLPWVSKKTCSKYQEIPAASSHQEEEDENALNEALEARFMELIASSPATESHVTLNERTTTKKIPADPSVANLFSYQGTFVASLPAYKTQCQKPEVQTAA